MKPPAHSVLRRQLKRCFESPDHIPSGLQAFIEAIDAAYRQADLDRTMLERSFELTSQELTQANANLHAVVTQLHDAQRDLEDRVRARTSELAEANDTLGLKV